MMPFAIRADRGKPAGKQAALQGGLSQSSYLTSHTAAYEGHRTTSKERGQTYSNCDENQRMMSRDGPKVEKCRLEQGCGSHCHTNQEPVCGSDVPWFTNWSSFIMFILLQGCVCAKQIAEMACSSSM